MVKFRQHIRPGQSGRDVLAVKDAMHRMHVHDSGSLNLKSNFAGSEFVRCIKHVQKNHGLKQDGIYGKMTHQIIAPHFSAWDRLRYRTAKIRQIPHPPAPKLSGQAAARRILELHAQGKYRADNPGDLYDIQRTAKGLPVWSPAGYWVHLDKRPLEALVWLIERGFHIGTFALCSDHHGLDGPHGHNGGRAVDISSINGISVAAYSPAAREVTLKIADLLHHHMPVTLKPWQLICDGYGNVYDAAISSLIIPSKAFYDYSILREHRNHIHLGYYE